MKTKICSKCKIEKSVSDFYLNSYTKKPISSCKECQKERDKLRNKSNTECGSDFIYSQPNEYYDENQKKCTFKILEKLGYLYINGIWIKPGYKELIDGKIIFLKLKKYKKEREKKVDQFVFNEIIEYHKKGWPTTRICMKLKLSNTTINKYIREWKEESSKSAS